MIRRAMILAAGLGTRLRPLTDHVPKPVVPIGNRPLIEYHLDALERLGVEDVVINLHHLPEQIEREVRRRGARPPRVHYSVETARLMGTGGGLAFTRRFFERERDFLLVNGDLLHGFDLRRLIVHHRAANAVATLLVRPHRGGVRIGWIGVDASGRVRRVPDMAPGPDLTRRAFPGIHVLTPRIFEYLGDDRPNCILRTGYRGLLEAGLPVAAYDAEAKPWIDIGTPRDLLAGNLLALRASEARTPLPRHGVVVPPVLLGDRVAIHTGARLGPRVVAGDDVNVGVDASVRDALLLEGARVAEREVVAHAIVFGNCMMPALPPGRAGRPPAEIERSATR